MTSLGRSIRKACLLVGLPQASYDYQPVAGRDYKLREKIRELAHQRRRFGCPRIHLLLRREGLLVMTLPREYVENTGKTLTAVGP